MSCAGRLEGSLAVTEVECGPEQCWEKRGGENQRWSLARFIKVGGCHWWNPMGIQGKAACLLCLGKVKIPTSVSQGALRRKHNNRYGDKWKMGENNTEACQQYIMAD